MKIILENNSFTMDTREARLTRLKLLKQNIMKFAPEISLEQKNLDWALSALDNFKNLLDEQEKIFLTKNRIFQESSVAENDLYTRYIAIKELMLSKVGKSASIRKKDFFNEPFPVNKLKRFEFASKLIQFAKDSSNDFKKLEIPFLLFENLEVLKNNAEKKHRNAVKIKEESSQITTKVNDHFDKDSVILREIYNWVVAFWSKKDPNLIKLGFTLPSSIEKNNNTPKAVFNLKYENNLLIWDKVLNAEFYQIAFRVLKSGKDFKEFYKGDENQLRMKEDLNDSSEFKVRAFNRNGQGPWSNKIEINF